MPTLENAMVLKDLILNFICGLYEHAINALSEKLSESQRPQ